MESMVGIGLTVIEKLMEGPEQVLEIGVTINTDVRETLPRFQPVKAVTVSVPLVARVPTGMLVLVQLYFVPLTGDPPKNILPDTCV
jgi:hypothetical protein